MKSEAFENVNKRVKKTTRTLAWWSPVTQCSHAEWIGGEFLLSYGAHPPIARAAIVSSLRLMEHPAASMGSADRRECGIIVWLVGDFRNKFCVHHLVRLVDYHNRASQYAGEWSVDNFNAVSPAKVAATHLRHGNRLVMNFIDRDNPATW